MKDNLKTFLSAKNATSDSVDLYFYGEIASDWWGALDDTDQYPEAIRDFLKEHDGKNLNIYINSGGGNVFAGMAIYNMLLRHKGKKTVYIDGVAASIASVIALAGDEINMPSNAFMMIHKPQMACDGNADDMRKAAKELDEVESGIVSVYRTHLLNGVSEEEIRSMIAEETWLNGEEAAKYFKLTVAPAKTYAAKISSDIISRYTNAPRMVIQAAQGMGEKQQEEKKKKIKIITIQGITKGD